MDPSLEAPEDLGQLLLNVATALPPHELELVLGDLPMPELARLSCVHKAYRDAWRRLQRKGPWKRYEPPSAHDIKKAKGNSRLARASRYGDVAVIRSRVAAGVDEHGTPLLEATEGDGNRVVDEALQRAAHDGRVQAVELLLAAGADVHACCDQALQWASHYGHAAVVQLLVQNGADVHADDDWALYDAAAQGLADVVQLLLQHDAHGLSSNEAALILACISGLAADAQMLIQQGADVHSGG